MDQRLEPHKRFAFLRQGLVDPPKIVVEPARRLALVVVSLRKSFRLGRERQNALRKALHRFLESLVGARVSVIAAGRRDKGAPGTIHGRTGASWASGSVSQSLLTGIRKPITGSGSSCGEVREPRAACPGAAPSPVNPGQAVAGEALGIDWNTMPSRWRKRFRSLLMWLSMTFSSMPSSKRP